MRARTSRLLLLLLAGLAGAAARADAPPGTVYLDVKEGTLTYTVVHKLHEVKGVSKQIEGRVAVLPSGAARVQVRAKVKSFDSGNSNRDVHAREVTHEVIHPYASVRGTVDGVKLPLAAPLELTMTAMVELNGERGQFSVPLKLEPAGAGVRGRFSVTISLDAFKVERPELLFVKVDDKVVIDGELLFEPASAQPTPGAAR